MEIDKIKTWNDWCTHYQNIEVFNTLIEEICQIENIEYKKVESTYPGTNAVFKIGDFILKLFVPDNITSWDSEYFVEINRMNLLKDKKIKIPEMISYGSVQKKILCRYIIYKRVEGKHFFKIRNSLTSKQKESVVKDLKEYISVLRSLRVSSNFIDFSSRVKNNDRLNFLKLEVKEEIAKYCRKFNKTKLVCVHGDLTGDNVLYIDDTGIYVIDFGDSQEAPFFYEFA